MTRIGLAITEEEYNFLIRGTNEIYSYYWIKNWDKLGELREETIGIIFSREWFLGQGIEVVENVISLTHYYQENDINTYYLNLEFDQFNETHLRELHELLSNEIYNVLIGNHYDVMDLISFASHNMSETDWEEWLNWLDNYQNHHKLISDEINEGKDYEKFSISKDVVYDKFQKAQQLGTLLGENILLKANEWIEKAQSFKVEKMNKDAQNIKTSQKRVESKPSRMSFDFKETLLQRININLLKEKAGSIWLVFKRVYLKGTLFILLGIIIAGVGLKPLIEMNVSGKNAIDEWESIKQNQATALVPTEKPILDEVEELSSTQINKETDMIGIIRLPNKENAIGVRLGTSNAILNKGAGLDESSNTQLGKRGNSVVYGHREEVFWELKNIKKGDIITVETLEGEFKYEVVNTRVTYPEDETIYQYTKKNMLTLVTCHPFIYMGATPERFVVEAELVN